MMEENVRKDALNTLNKVIEILIVPEVSNHTLHNASVFQDEVSVSIAVLIYSLSKIIERNQSQFNYKMALSYLQTAKKYLQSNQEPNFNITIKKLFSEISKLDNMLKLYIEEVITQAQIKKGSRIYEHGKSI